VSESVELSEIRQSLQARRQAVIDEFRLKPNADRLVHELRRITDDALRQLLRLHPLPKQAALTAVGWLWAWRALSLLGRGLAHLARSAAKRSGRSQTWRTRGRPLGSWY